MFTDPPSIEGDTEGFPEVFWAYFICAISTLFVSLCFLYVYVETKLNDSSPSIVKEKSEVNEDTKKENKQFRFVQVFF